MSDERIDVLLIPASQVIDADDPLLPLFVFHHDLRERFLIALEDILRVTVEGRSYKTAVERMRAIAAEAIDADAIEAWVLAGRPLRTLDQEDRLVVAKQIDNEVRSVFDRMAEGLMGGRE